MLQSNERDLENNQIEYIHRISECQTEIQIINQK